VATDEGFFKTKGTMTMNFNFELILFYAVLISGLITLFDKCFLKKKRELAYEQQTKGLASPPEKKLPIIIDYAYSFFPVLLLVFFLRSFLYEPFRIPSGSLEPTLLIGDFIVVNKFDYGIRLPVLHKKIFKLSDPKRGDIIVFRWPVNPSIDFIKRVIGIPGDHIKYIDKVLYVNGQKIPQDAGFSTQHRNDSGEVQAVIQKQEDLLGVKHDIYQIAEASSTDFNDIVVPEGMYFAMGDNRDNSADSRYWGFVPDKNIVGKASVTWLSWDSQQHNIRWKRFGAGVH
jgi:signal peptidase I